MSLSAHPLSPAPLWHTLEPEVVTRQLSVAREHGLTEADVDQRRKRFGLNELVERGAKSPWKILAEQLSAVMVLILLAAALLSALLGKWTETISILAIVLLFALLGFFQEYRAEKAMAALKKLAVPSVRVRRGGVLREISARELVPGDIITLEAGNLVPADVRLLESVNLRLQEAALTGESEPVEKEAGAQAGPTPPRPTGATWPTWARW